MDKVTCQMLLWLISNCEDSQLVDIALQSVAGARPGFPVAMLVEANVTELVVQRLNSCLVLNSRTNTISLKHATSIETVGLYVQALARLLESDAGFKLSSKHRVTQLDYKLLNTFSNPNSDKRISKFTSFFSDRLGEDGDITTIATSIAVPLCYHMSAGNSSTPLEARYHASIIQLRNDQLIRSHLNRGVAIDSRALLALLEAAPHWIIRRTTPTGNIVELRSSIMLLVQLIRSPSCSAPEFQYALGLALTIVAVLMHNYPGWEHPQNNVWDRATRAIEVYRHYRVEHHEEPRRLLAFGLLGLLRGVSETSTTFRKDEITALVAVLTQIKDFHSIAGYHLHTFPNTLTIAQHARMTLLGTLQAVVNWRSDFGETALIPCLTQLLLEVDALKDSNIAKLALKAFLGLRNNRLQRTCSKLLPECILGLRDSLEDLEPAQTSGLIDISLSNDAYSAPTAMACLWKLIKWLIGAAKRRPNGQPTNVLADMLKHEAFASLRAKAPDLPVSPRSIFEVGLADMRYPLLKEMKGHKYAASIVSESGILSSMCRSDGAYDAVPYLEELRDGQSWYNKLMELSDMQSSCDVGV
ncbi:hypothetical protein FRC09_008164 [Ceratobasidium sp. 395]|nr:hypothetical protein FRC09_008164 [Ceratobasidium sp. 395]